MSPEQLAVAVKSAGVDDPVFAALTQLMNEALADETESALLPSLTAEGRAYNCGRAAGIVDVLETIKGFRS